MSGPEADNTGDDAARRLTFGRYVLDFERGCLLSHGREITLRPQALAVLTLLARHSGQRVPAAQISAAVWPGIVGSDPLLLQSIGELRRALGDADGRLIVFDLEQGAMLQTAAAAPERRRAAGVQPLRFRWMYGLVAPLVVAAVFAGIWFTTSRGLAVRQGPPLPAVAVLPFQDQSDDGGFAPQADELTRQLIAALRRDSPLPVKSWDEVAVYRGVLAQPGEVARVLAVTYQVEGSVRYAEGQIRVSAQLVDLRRQVLWSSRYVEPAAQVDALRERMAGDITAALAAAL